MSNNLWTTFQVIETTTFSFILGCHQKWMIYVYFSFSFSSKLTLVTSINCICNYKPLCNHLCDYKSFLPNAMKDSHIYSHKNGWFGHKSQMHGLEWTWFLVVTLWKNNCKYYLVLQLGLSFSNPKIVCFGDDTSQFSLSIQICFIFCIMRGSNSSFMVFYFLFKNVVPLSIDT